MPAIRKPLTVTQLCVYINKVAESDMLLSGFYLEGELSNMKLHSSGHVYFTIKDENSAINCVMWKTYANALPFQPENGMRVILRCRAGLYEKSGSFQLYAESMELCGTGSLTIAFEQLKRKLSAEGLFDEEHKKELPFLPERIALVTSPTGSVVRDMINVRNRRNSAVKLLLVPVSVQGENAASEISAAITIINTHELADVIIVGRGGGSIEDLWAFNEEVVARAVFNSRIPVVSAVGHETDYTITDFVADLRAPTPSAAMELATPRYDDLSAFVEGARNKLLDRITNIIDDNKTQIKSFFTKRNCERLINKIYNHELYVSDIKERYNKTILNKFDSERYMLESAAKRLDALSPDKLFKRGYSMLFNEDDQAIRSVNEVNLTDIYKLKINDGNLDIKVINK